MGGVGWGSKDRARETSEALRRPCPSEQQAVQLTHAHPLSVCTPLIHPYEPAHTRTHTSLTCHLLNSRRPASRPSTAAATATLPTTISAMAQPGSLPPPLPPSLLPSPPWGAAGVSLAVAAWLALLLLPCSSPAASAPLLLLLLLSPASPAPLLSPLRSSPVGALGGALLLPLLAGGTGGSSLPPPSG